jgi:hypothetical protein
MLNKKIKKNMSGDLTRYKIFNMFNFKFINYIEYLCKTRSADLD